METPDSDHGRCEGVHLPTDDALESVDHLSPHFEGIYTEVRHGPRMDRGKGEAGFFCNRESVHFGPNHQSGAGSP